MTDLAEPVAGGGPAEPPDPPAAEPPAAPPGREVDLLVAGAALLLLVAYAPELDQAPTTLRVLLVAPVGAAGLVVLGRLVLARDRAALWAAGYLAWAGIATLASINPWQSFYSGFGTDRGWLAVALFLGWYAAGRRRGPAGESLLVGALAIGLIANSALAIAQVIVHGSGLLATSEGRGLGFAPSPVYLGTLTAGAIVFAAWGAGRTTGRWWLWLGAVALFSAGANASGSRSGLVGGVVIALIAIRRADRRRIALVVVAVAFGVVAMIPFGQGDSSAGRIGGGSGGMSPRIAMWEIAVDRVADRPVVGWGPNQFLDVATQDIDAAFARSEGPDKVYFDAHNLAVEHLFGTGVPGLILLGGFAWFAARRTRGPLACFAAGAAVTWLLEPASISTAPLVLLALGAATIGGEPPPLRGAGRAAAAIVTTLAVLVAGIGAGRLLVADHLVHQGSAAASLADLATARRMFPHDAVLSDAEAQLLLTFAKMDRNDYGPRAEAAARRTTALQPDRATWWYRLAEVQYAVGRGTRQDRAEAAHASLLRAHQLNPWSADTLEGLEVITGALGDDAASARWHRRLCEVTECGPG